MQHYILDWNSFFIILSPDKIFLRLAQSKEFHLIVSVKSCWYDVSKSRMFLHILTLEILFKEESNKWIEEKEVVNTIEIVVKREKRNITSEVIMYGGKESQNLLQKKYFQKIMYNSY